ncbi:MAG: phosphatase PAP2 family protein [Candidatus Baltobacteraceae bacterium]
MSARLYLVSLVCFFLFVLLGLAIVKRPRVLWDVRARSFRSQFLGAALLLTASGRTRPLLSAYAVALGAFALGHLHVWIPIVMALSQIASQSVVEGFKLVYKRVRPDYWLGRLDKGHSYPSGHAATAVISYMGWAVIILHSALPPGLRWPLACAFVLWAVGIGWSRLALGAHYFSDVFGGAMFGTAWLCALIGATGNLMLVP